MGFAEKSLTKLQQERAELIAEAERLQAAVVDMSDPDEIKDTEETLDGILDALEKNSKQLARAEKIHELAKAQGGPRDKVTPVQLDQPIQERKVKIPATCLRVRPTNFKKEEIDGMTADERAYAFGRYLLATAARTQPGLYSHLGHYVQKHEDAFGPMNAASEGGNAGLWVPTQFGTDVTELLLKYGVARQECDVKTMSSDKRTDPKVGSDPTPTFVGEGTAGSDITPTDDSLVTLTAKKLMGILIQSSELNEDAVMEFGNSMIARLANSFAAKEDNCWINGDGTSTYGGMKGLVTLMQSIDGAGTDANGLSTQGTGTTWGAITIGDFEAVAGSLPDFRNNAEDNAKWLCHKSFYFNVMARVSLASGGVTSMEVANGMRTPMMLGWPVVWTNQMASATAVTTVSCLFGDFRRGCSFGDRRAYSIDFSREASVGSVDLWSSDQIGIRATERFDIQNHSLGDASTNGAVVGLQTGT